MCWTDLRPAHGPDPSSQATQVRPRAPTGAFNNVQFSTVNANAVFDQAGNQVNDEFGYYTAARDARRIQLMLRLQF